ncbi:MAG: 30S ribosome-binding factor RbfA [Gammaproteobacteria bacterium]|nr:30S ribosome-binding factor RbfA [Gammaproteobacteria bacterium]
MPREFTRKQRVGAEIQRLLNELLRVEVKDPRLDGVTVNDVELSGDLGVAKVYYGTLYPDEDATEAQQAFASATGFLRSRVGQALRLRRVPELHFIRDTSAKRGLELSRLLDELGAGERSGEAPDPDDRPEGADGEPDDGRRD